jgi:hypothetical protein
MTKLDLNIVSLWLKTQLDGSEGFAILDGENAIMNISKKDIFFTNFFNDSKKMNLRPIIVGKISNIKRLQTRIPDVQIPNDILYFFLHGDNKKCPDDAFIIELYATLKLNGIHSKIFTIDKFSNRKNWETKVFNTMISYNLFPNRPRTIKDPRTIIYSPNMSLILGADLSDKISLRNESDTEFSVSIF